MTLWARFTENGASKGVVAETFEFPTNPNPLFVPSWLWVEAPTGTVQQSTFDGKAWTNPPPPPLPPIVIPPTPIDPVIASIEAEKVRRIEAGFLFMGKMIQSRTEDRENIAGAKSAAQDAKLLDAQPGDYGWQLKLDPVNGMTAFGWITLDNSILPLDADQMIAMGYAAMLHKQRFIFLANSLKQRAASGEDLGDVTRDALWG